jgi:uncharacterized membrane protein (DUF485 family)
MREPSTPPVDWEAIEHTPEFQELTRRRRNFVVPCTIFFLAYYMAFILLAGYAPDFMAESVYEGLTVGYVLALTQFVMVGVLGIWYLKKSERVFDPLARKAIEAYMSDDERAAADRADLPKVRNGRFGRSGPPADGATPDGTPRAGATRP